MARVAIPEPAEHGASGRAPPAGRPAPARTGDHPAWTVYPSSRLPLRVLEAARYRIAQINVGPIGQALSGGWRPGGHVAAGDGAPPDAAFHAAVADWRASPLFGEPERLAIDLAERMALDPHGFVDDDDYWRRLHAAFDDDEIVDLIFAVGAWTAAAGPARGGSTSGS